MVAPPQRLYREDNSTLIPLIPSNTYSTFQPCRPSIHTCELGRFVDSQLHGAVHPRIHYQSNHNSSKPPDKQNKHLQHQHRHQHLRHLPRPPPLLLLSSSRRSLCSLACTPVCLVRIRLPVRSSLPSAAAGGVRPRPGLPSGAARS